jgi:transposase InsO family protein
MKKEEIRKEFFKLRIEGHSYAQSRKLLKSALNYDVSIRTLKRWEKKINSSEWDLKDKSRRPFKIYYKVTELQKQEIIALKKKTGFGEWKIASYVGLSHTTINKILSRYNLLRKIDGRRKRIKYIRWQRDHPNSLWQMDVSDQKVDGKYCFAVIDDCSRYCLGLFEINNTSTKIITKILDGIIKIHGKPREILSDNGSVFGFRSKHSKFDRWCNRNKIKHIRTAIHSPTTTGKIERFFQTLANELPFCRKSLDCFRMRYNHFRPHSSLHGKAPADIYFAFDKLF